MSLAGAGELRVYLTIKAEIPRLSAHGRAIGVLRLRGKFAARTFCSAQDDRWAGRFRFHTKGRGFPQCCRSAPLRMTVTRECSASIQSNWRLRVAPLWPAAIRIAGESPDAAPRTPALLRAPAVCESGRHGIRR